MDNKYLNQLKDIVLTELADEPVQVLLFGSRARGDFHAGSDVDIGLIPRRQINPFKFSILKEKIEDSSIPYKVDIVNLSEVSDEFLEHALKGAVLWKNWN